MPRLLILAALSLAVLLASLAAAAQVRPEDAIAYRQSVFKMVFWNFGPMGAMVRGQRPFDAAEFERRALRVANLSNQALEGFPEGSDTGAPTDALPAIWTNRADFEAKMLNWRREARALYEVARSGDEAAIRTQFQATAAACKACHDVYRAN